VQEQQRDYSVEQSIIEERAIEIKNLENELRTLNEMFVDISTMVETQGEMIYTIEENTTVGAKMVEKGVGELRTASHYQKSARTKLCCILLLVIIIVAAIGITFGIIFGFKP
jgi:syntaxin 1B/2/3